MKVDVYRIRVYAGVVADPEAAAPLVDLECDALCRDHDVVRIGKDTLSLAGARARLRDGARRFQGQLEAGRVVVKMGEAIQRWVVYTVVVEVTGTRNRWV